MCISHKYQRTWLYSPLAVETSGCSSPPHWVDCDLYLTRINQALPHLGLKLNDFCSEVLKILALSEVKHHDITPWEHLRSCDFGWKVSVLEGFTESPGKVLALVKTSKLLRKIPHSRAYSKSCFRHRTWLKVTTSEEHLSQGQSREHWGDPCEEKMSPGNWFSPDTSTPDSKSGFWKLIF